MIFENKNMRRQKQAISEQDAKKLLTEGEYGVLSLQSKTEGPYGVPFSYVWDGEETIYLHGAKEGTKVNYLKQDNNISFCIVGKTQIVSEAFTTHYKSIILKGQATLDPPREEKIKALELLIIKYSPDNIEEGFLYVQKSVDKTEVIKIVISEWSGKSH